MLIWIASYPRSGNNFLRMALYHLYGQKSVGIASRQPASRKSWSESTLLTSLSHEEMAAARELYLVKTHDLPGDSKHRAIYLVRDGRDALVSYAWYHLVRDQGMKSSSVDRVTYRIALHQLMTDRRSPFGDWSGNVLAWLRRPDTEIVKFEDLIRAPDATLAKVIANLRLPIQKCGARVPSFVELREKYPHHYRRGQVGAWRDEFPPDLVPLFWERHGMAMAAAGYPSETDANHPNDRAA